jgi:ureidoglycolate lyase
MKLATFRRPDGRSEVGVIVGDAVVPLTSTMPELAPDLIALARGWGAARASVERYVERTTDRLRLSEVTLQAPITRPGKVLAMGLNYADHAEESGQSVVEYQTWSSKTENAVAGPFDPVPISAGAPFVDYEAELVVVIGSGGRHLSAHAARHAVFGYCAGNDVTERAWQFRTDQWMLGKSFDGFAPIGPWVVTADEVPNPHDLRIQCRVNGELRQDASTNDMMVDIWDQIAYLSNVMTLKPGDLIFTGTPAGVGAALTPSRFLQHGDRVQIEIDSIGSIENRFVDVEAGMA